MRDTTRAPSAASDSVDVVLGQRPLDAIVESAQWQTRIDADQLVELEQIE